MFADTFPRETAGIVLEDVGWNEEKLKSRLSSAIWQEREKAIAQFSSPLTIAIQHEKDDSQTSVNQAADASSCRTAQSRLPSPVSSAS